MISILYKQLVEKFPSLDIKTANEHLDFNGIQEFFLSLQAEHFIYAAAFAVIGLGILSTGKMILKVIFGLALVGIFLSMAS